MNFMKYPTKNDISISNAVLKLAKLQNAERLELTAATGAVIVTSGRMTVKELLSTVQSLTGRAAELMTLLRLTCGDCTNCSEKCAYRDRSITELIRPAVVVPDWARQDAGLAGDAKLDCYVDEDTHELTVVEADYAHDLSDVPPELLFALHQSGCCLSALEDALMEDDVIYDTCKRSHATVTMGAAHPTCIPCSKAAEKRSPPPREDCAHLMDPGEVRDGPPRRTHSIGDLIQRNRTSKKAWSL